MVNQITQAHTAEKFKPADEFVITDLEALKVLADPLRLKILQYLMKPSTVKIIAEKIDKPPTKLYYHFNLLEKHGLIQMVDTRIVSGIIEKHYQASARLYRVDRNLLSPESAQGDQGLDVTLSGLFGDARNDIRESMQAGVIDTSEDAPEHRRLFITQGPLKLTPEQSTEFYHRLLALVKEFDIDANEDNPDAQAYKLLLLLHPSHRLNTSSGD